MGGGGGDGYADKVAEEDTVEQPLGRLGDQQQGTRQYSTYSMDLTQYSTARPALLNNPTDTTDSTQYCDISTLDGPILEIF